MNDKWASPTPFDWRSWRTSSSLNMLWMCLHVFMSMCVYMYVCICMLIYDDQRLILGVFLYHSEPCFLVQCLSVNLGLWIQLRWLCSKMQGIFLSLHSQCWGYRHIQTHFTFYENFGVPNLDPHTCLANFLQTEPSPKLSVFF